MLNKRYRLTKNRHFQFVYKNGVKVFAKNSYLVYVPTKIKPCKIGVVVSNKVGKAVVRNKVKRQIRSIIDEILQFLNNDNNYVIVAKPEIIHLDYLKLRKEIIYLFKKANLLNEDIN